MVASILVVHPWIPCDRRTDKRDRKQQPAKLSHTKPNATLTEPPEGWHEEYEVKCLIQSLAQRLQE